MSIEVVDCVTLDEFWGVISPIGERFGRPHTSFIFRGQWDSELKLVPKVFRPEVINKYKRGMMATLSDPPGQSFFELSLLKDFISYCDETGLAIPGDAIDFRRYVDQIMDKLAVNNRAWPEERIWPLMALAQHHGIPTRLLDWSSNPYVASYHAAASAISKGKAKLKGSEKIALFALDLNELHKATELRHVKVPGNTSPNIAPQGGSFILVMNFGSRGTAFTSEVSMESKLPDHVKLLTKVTLPTMLAGDLLLRCDKFKIPAASVFPGYDGNAKAVLEWRLAFHFNEE
jgi:FRG domain